MPPLFVSRDREKLINAIIYFLRETKHVHTLKLFKLLYFSDFEHFRQKGRTIFGLDYSALAKGPVPIKLLDELSKGGNADLKNSVAVFTIKDDITDQLLRRDLKSRAEFNPRYFSKREMKILSTVAEFFKEFRAEDMSEFSHQLKMPWEKTWRNGLGKNHKINPELALEGPVLLHQEATIDREELERRKELLRDIA
jgi:uncharacterized phage-associated protein